MPEMSDDMEEPQTGRQRLLAALTRPGSRGQLTAAILLAVVGFAGVVQVQSTEENDVYAGARQEDLIQLLNSLGLASQRAENEIAELEQTRAHCGTTPTADGPRSSRPGRRPTCSASSPAPCPRWVPAC